MTSLTALAAEMTGGAETAKPKPAKKGPAPGKPQAPAASAKKAAPKEPKTGERPDGLRKGSKMAVMLDMVLRPEGATEAAVCKKLGWKKCRVTLRRVCEKVGAKLAVERPDDGPSVYRATMKKKAAA